MNLNEAQQIAGMFGFKGEIAVVRDMGKVTTDKGPLCIKRVNYSIDRLLYIESAKKYLIKQGFIYIDNFYQTPDGNPYVLFNDEAFIAVDWIEGRECEFHNINDVKAATETLAAFHKKVEGFLPDSTLKIRDELGLLPVTLRKRSEELSKLKKIAQKSKNRFDFLYSENADFFIKKSLSSLEIINSKFYTEAVNEAIKKKHYCHRDFSFHNLVFDKHDNLHIQNFDYFCSEIKIYDIASFMRKIMTEYNWDVDVALSIINWYDTIIKIGQHEMKLLFALLEFPQKFWRIANRYYNSRRTRPENGFYNKLFDVVSEKELYSNFLTKFKILIE